MAESVFFDFVKELLSTISTEVFKEAYGSVRSILYARDELAKLETSIQTIEAVLIVAEKQHGNDINKLWIKKIKDVLYDADDLFDEVTTDDMLKKRSNEGDKQLWVLKKVKDFFSYSKIFSWNSIAKKIQSIREKLDEILQEMTHFQILSKSEICTDSREGEESGFFIDATRVIGRDKDKKVILEMLFNESNHVEANVPLVIAIGGIGGMGKTALAQLIYNDIEVTKKFEKCWFACISNTSVKKETQRKICQAICGENCNGFALTELQSKIREGIKNTRFLLVLDDVWDGASDSLQDLLSLLGESAKDSRVIVTTRSVAVLPVDKSKTHTLDGLSAEDSLNLFKKIAFLPEYEKDPQRIDLANKIMKKCRNVPLAIKSIAELLREKKTIEEWKSINEKKLDENSGDGIFPVLKLSYDHLSSNLKLCFAYCSLFPEDHVFAKDELVYLWMAQGYISPNDTNEGFLFFMHLFRRGFFQDAEKDKYGSIESCKMHDLIHDLALHVAGEECLMLSTSSNIAKRTRHVSVGTCPDNSWDIPASLINVNGLRSFLFLNNGSISKLISVGSISEPVLEKLLESFKLLRTLELSGLSLKKIPSCIGELKHLRYLDLSGNEFESVPDSVTNLVNLLALNLRICHKLKRLPENFRKLIHLRYLDIRGCLELKHMPPGIEELTCLEYLSNFKVGKASEGVQMSGIDALSRLQKLRGNTNIWFDSEIKEWEGDGCWLLPVFLQQLYIYNYPGIRIPHWCKLSKVMPKLASLHLWNCDNVKYLPPLRRLPGLRFLFLQNLKDLEYVEEEEGSSDASASTSTSTFFPCLEKLDLYNLPNLKGWRREAAPEAEEHLQQRTFPPLELNIGKCENLMSLPLSSRIQNLRLVLIQGKVINNLLSTSPNLLSLVEITIAEVSHLEVLQLTLPHLTTITLRDCALLSLHLKELTSLRSLSMDRCYRLKNIALPNGLEVLSIFACNELEYLWEQDEDERKRRGSCGNKRKRNMKKRGSCGNKTRMIDVDGDKGKRKLWERDESEDDEKRSLFNWNSLTRLRELHAGRLPPLKKLPNFLQQRHASHKLKINDQ